MYGIYDTAHPTEMYITPEGVMTEDFAMFGMPTLEHAQRTCQLLNGRGNQLWVVKEIASSE